MESCEGDRGLTSFGDMYSQYMFMLWLWFDMLELSATVYSGRSYFVENIEHVTHATEGDPK